jgi:type II secretory pathway component PulJ
MKMTRIITIKPLKFQKGMTLIELLIAGVISLIAVSGMVLVMATTLGTTTQTIEMTRLTQEMRTAMQIMTRELRRANYHPGFIACVGNTGCLGENINEDDLTYLEIDTWIKPVLIGTNILTNDCLSFWYDRPQNCPFSSCTDAQLAAAQTAVNSESVAAFRRAAVNGGVGRIQMVITKPNASCDDDDDDLDWVDITDPNIMDVLTFTINSESYIEEIATVGGPTQAVDKIGLTMQAKLTADASVPPWIQNLNEKGQTRELVDFVKVRNNTIAP